MNFYFFQSSSQTSLSNVIDFSLVPILPKDFDVLESENIQQIFSALEFRSPAQGEWMWRIPGYFTINDIDVLFDKLKIGLESGIVENETEGLNELNTTKKHFDKLVKEQERKERGDHYSNDENNENQENIENEEDLNNKNHDLRQENNGDNILNKENNKKDVINKSNQNKEEENDDYHEDEDENFLDIETNGNSEKKMNEKILEPTLPLATLDNFEEENEKSKSKKWVDQTLVVLTLQPE